MQRSKLRLWGAICEGLHSQRMADFGAMPRPVSLPGQCFSHYPIMSRLCMLSGLHLLWFSVAWMDCTLGNPPKADPTSLAIHINGRLNSSHRFNRRILRLAQWGFKKESRKKKRKAKRNLPSQSRPVGWGRLWVATAVRGTAADWGNDKVTNSVYKERHSLGHSATSSKCLIGT